MPITSTENHDLKSCAYAIFSNPTPLSKAEVAARLSLVILGALWGVPWTQPSSDAAVFFPDQTSKNIFSNIFAAGIVITVGLDGIWIMLQVGKLLGSKSPAETALMLKSNKCTKIVTPVFLALFSCISAVYASVKFNNGINQFFSILTFIGNLGYGFYGYSKLIEKIRLYRRDSRADKNLINVRNGLINNINYIINNGCEIPSNIMDGDNLISYLQTEALAEAEIGSRATTNSKMMFQIISSIILPVSSSIVGIILTNEFLKNNIYSNGIFSLLMALLSETPNWVVSVISTYDIFGRLYDVLACKQNKRLEDRLYPRMSGVVIPLCALVVALTAPTAAAYITYNTLDQADATYQWMATIAIILSRMVFSSFTQNTLGNKLLLFFGARRPDADSLKQHNGLKKLADAFLQANPNFFRSIAPLHLQSSGVSQSSIAVPLLS